jgi:hypothetical protein
LFPASWRIDPAAPPSEGPAGDFGWMVGWLDNSQDDSQLLKVRFLARWPSTAIGYAGNDLAARCSESWRGLFGWQIG